MVGLSVDGTHLSFFYSGLTELPQFRTEWAKVRVLDLDGNRIRHLSPEISKFRQLRTLWLTGNGLETLPAELAQLRHLEGLFLDRNLLTILPVEIEHMRSLRIISVRDNRIGTLHPSLAPRLRAGMSLKTDGNALQGPLPDLTARGADAVSTYLESLSDATTQYEGRVLLVGEGNVGKSTLVNALTGAAFEANRQTTHGLEVHDLSLAHPSKPSVTMSLKVWDFGGQEVYRITHQFFFSSRALYVVAWNTREGHEKNDVERWIKTIRLRAGRSVRIIVVATHGDERRAEFDLPYFITKYPESIAGFVVVDSYSKSGFDDLRALLSAEAAELPQMGQEISDRWVEARRLITSLSIAEPFILWDQFHGICKRCRFATDEEISTFAQLLHDVGAIIHFPDDDGLREIVVLNPEWLSKAIGKVLEDADTRENRGLLAHGRLKDIWGVENTLGPRYESRHFPFFLRLMEKFDISFRLFDEKESLVPQLVPHGRPTILWDASSSGTTRVVRLICRLVDAPDGLISWLTVKHRGATTSTYWRSGVFLTHPTDAYASQALLELVDSRSLMIEVRAPSPDMYVNVLRDSVEELIRRRWPGLKFEFLVPCPTVRNGTSCSGMFPLVGLLRRRDAGKSHQNCLICDEDLDIELLLTGFAGRRTKMRHELERLHEGLREVGLGVKDLTSIASDSLDQIRRVNRAVSAEFTDCPTVFSIRDSKGGRRTIARAKRVAVRSFDLTLWCEQPDAWHPSHKYRFSRPAEWIAELEPYARLAFRTLQVVVPLAKALSGLPLSSSQIGVANKELEAMKDLLEAAQASGPPWQNLDLPGALNMREGQALRAYRVLLFELDPTRSFGDLRRVQTEAGDFIWICEAHKRAYDPGLPRIDA